MLRPRVTQVTPAGQYRLAISFSDGTMALMDFTGLTRRSGVFEPLKNQAFFDQVRVNDVGTIEWPGELDLCPDVLYHLATGAPLPAEGFLDRDPGIVLIRVETPQERQKTA